MTGQLPAGCQSHGHQRGHHYKEHIWHEPGKELHPRLDRQTTQNGADDEPHKEIDPRPEPAPHHVEEVERPEPVTGDGDDQEAEDHANDRDAGHRHDLHRRSYRWGS